MCCHYPLRMVTIYFATHTHRDITNFTEKFISILTMTITKSKVKNGVIFYYFSVMFCRYLIFVMLIVTFFTEVNFLSKTINISFLVLTFLTFYHFDFFVLIFSKWKLNQIIWKSLKLFEYFKSVSINLILLCALFVNNWIESLWRTKVIILGLRIG